MLSRWQPYLPSKRGLRSSWNASPPISWLLYDHVSRESALTDFVSSPLLVRSVSPRPSLRTSPPFPRCRPKTYLLGNDFYQQSVCDAYLWGGQFAITSLSQLARHADWFESSASDNIAGRPPPKITQEKGKSGGLF